jgi:predicted dehydrogenase
MKPAYLSRRGFLQRSLTALTVGAGLPLWYAREVLADEQEKQDKKPANDPIIFGAIGIGSPQSRGRAIAGDALRAGKEGVRYAAICDVDGRHRKNAVEFMTQRGQKDVREYHDFRELLDRKDIQAVTIATPDHWHALVAIEALKKGKDVYCEKPLTLTIAEGQAVVRAAQQSGRVFQVGSQQRSDARFRLACELVRNGRIGKVRRVETRIGANPISPPLPVVEPPKELDWDFWLGPAPKVDYRELVQGKKTYTRCHYEFRWWYEYSGGKMTDWGAHHNDIAQWGLGMDGSGPMMIEAEGEAPATGPDHYNCHPHFKVTYKYGDDTPAGGARLICSDSPLPDAPDAKEQGHGNGILFVGESGQWIFVTRGRIAASDQKLIDEPLRPDATRLYVSRNHMGNFLECIRTRKPTICTAEIGYRSVSVCHLGVIALRSGKKLRWDPAKEQFADAAANEWLRREMRAPWKLVV